MYKFLLYYVLQSLGVCQQQLNRETTPQEHQLSIQDSAYKYQHQLRTGINPQQIPICQHVRDMLIVHHVYLRDLPILQHAYVHALAHYKPVYTFRN